MDTSSAEPQWGVLSALPGNPIMWVLIISEMLVFGAFFLGFAAARMRDPATFQAGQASLDVIAGGLNTLILVTSGYCVARAVRARALGQGIHRWLAAGMALGVAFLAVKGHEYGREFAAGHNIDSDTFFTLFFLITGFHALHVVMGLCVLAIVAWRDSLENLETGAAFWHMVDLVWLILFPLVYLLR
ncbi:MAG: cytochrome c oxidase subunit 3 family protein [Magnetospirillum sp.]|nr:cytochrome c oxidase subunit 3 family protein [Magnetospirillum sp.]